MRRVGVGLLCVLTWLCTAMPVSAIGFDPRGAREADGLSREFDDATRLQQLQEAPQLPPVPVVEKSRPQPPSAENASPDGTGALVEAAKLSSTEQATESLQQAERQLRQQQGNTWARVAWRFLWWSIFGGALAWAIWSWMVRRASNGVNLG